MALISTYWGLVRPLRHHFRTGSQAAIASKEHLRNRPILLMRKARTSIDTHNPDAHLCRMCGAAGRLSAEGPVHGNHWPIAVHRDQLNHPLLGNAATRDTWET